MNNSIKLEEYLSKDVFKITNLEVTDKDILIFTFKDDTFFTDTFMQGLSDTLHKTVGHNRYMILDNCKITLDNDTYTLIKQLQEAHLENRKLKYEIYFLKDRTIWYIIKENFKKTFAKISLYKN